MIDQNRLLKILSLTNLDYSLVFSFKPQLSGITYSLLNTEGEEKVFLESGLTVRDRNALSRSPIWRQYNNSFFKKLFFVRLDNCIYLCSQDIWSPSVDAAIFIDTLYELRHKLKNCKSLLDLGFGSGVTSIGTINILHELEKVYLFDTNPIAATMCETNFYLNNFTTKRIYLSETDLPDTYADICVTAPYYIPVDKGIIESPSEDILYAINNTAEMINYCISHSNLYAIFIISSITEREVSEKINWKFQIVAEKKVPFTIGDNVGNMNVIKKLLDENRIICEDNHYYHIVKICITEK